MMPRPTVLGVEEPFPWRVAAIAITVLLVLIGFAITLGAWW